jgi:hypothetical protein
MTAQSSCRYYYSSTTCLFPVPQFSKTHATVPRTSEDSLAAVTCPASLLHLKSLRLACCRCARFVSAGGGVYRFAFDSSSFSFSARRLLASDFFPLRQRGAASTSTAFSRQAPVPSFFQGLLSCALPTAFSLPGCSEGGAVYCHSLLGSRLLRIFLGFPLKSAQPARFLGAYRPSQERSAPAALQPSARTIAFRSSVARSRSSFTTRYS